MGTPNVVVLRIFLGAAMLLLAGCVTRPYPDPKADYPVHKPSTDPAAVQRPAGPLPPSARPVYNLTGYPAATQEGYIDGCETAKQSAYAYKDAKRYKADGQYRMGWDDGFSICRKTR
ncbi:MAG: hypothetical protein RI993_948 [Pseudomonadota bacterium]|jgi:hypothetical protein